LPGLDKAAASPRAAALCEWRAHFSDAIDAHGGCAPTVDAQGLAPAAGLDIHSIG
jgi:hypothetical protein